MAFFKQGRFAIVSGPISKKQFREFTNKDGEHALQFSVYAGKRHNDDGRMTAIYMPVTVSGALYDMVADPDVGFSPGEVVFASGVYEEWEYNEKTYYKIVADFVCNASNIFFVAQSLLGHAEDGGLEETDEETVFDEPKPAPQRKPEPENSFAQQLEETDAELPFD